MGNPSRISQRFESLYIIIINKHTHRFYTISKKPLFCYREFPFCSCFFSISVMTIHRRTFFWSMSQFEATSLYHHHHHHHHFYIVVDIIVVIARRRKRIKFHFVYVMLLGISFLDRLNRSRSLFVLYDHFLHSFLLLPLYMSY